MRLPPTLGRSRPSVAAVPAVVSSTLLLFLLLPLPALAQAPEDATAAEPIFGEEPEAQEGDYVGVGTCANGICHGAGEPREDAEILGNEYTTRLLDPHFRAWEVLSNDLSREIMAAFAPGKNAPRHGLCLDCHAVAPPASKNLGVEIEDGISCEGCHGPAGGWWKRHYEEGWTHEQSLGAGMNDLRRPATRARVCMECHLGTGDQMVDHRLIAAGHPVLRFELDNYSQVENLKHWKSDAERDRRPSHGLRAWAVGQGVAFREGLELLAAKAGDDEAPWPAFAELSCASCHHVVTDAYSPSPWRERKGYEYRQGLPPWSPARWAVLRHLVEGEELDGRVQELNLLVTRMGPRVEVAALATSLANDLRPLLRKLDGERWSEKKAKKLMQRLREDGDYVLQADEATARQYALSLQSLAGYLVRQDYREMKAEYHEEIDRLFEVLDEPTWDPEAFVAVLSR